VGGSAVRACERAYVAVCRCAVQRHWDAALQGNRKLVACWAVVRFLSCLTAACLSAASFTCFPAPCLSPSPLQEELFGLEDGGLEDDDDSEDDFGRRPASAAGAARGGAGGKGGAPRGDSRQEREREAPLPEPEEDLVGAPGRTAARGCRCHFCGGEGVVQPSTLCCSQWGCCSQLLPSPTCPPCLPCPALPCLQFEDDEDDWLVHEDEEEGGAGAGGGGQYRRRRRRAALEGMPGVDPDALAVCT
jgi:hypothetical protein